MGITKNIKFKVTSDEQSALNGFDKVESKAQSLGSVLSKIGIAFGAMEVLQFGMRAIKASAQLDVLRSNFIGSAKDLELFRKATAQTVDDASLIKLSNYASELNLSLEQQAIAFSLAEDAADKFGGSVEEGFNKFVLASEGSKKALKNLGISQAEYKTAIDSILKTTGYRIEQLDLESQAEVRKQAILKASGLTLDDVNKKQQDNADKIESLSVAWTKLETAVGKLLGSPTMIKFFELTAKAVQGWAFILGAEGSDSSAGSGLRQEEFARAAIKMSADGLEINKRIVISQFKIIEAKMKSGELSDKEYAIELAKARSLNETISVLENMEFWKKKIAEIDDKAPSALNLSVEATAKLAEDTKKRLESLREIDMLTSEMSGIINKADWKLMNDKNKDFIDKYFSMDDKGGIKMKGADVNKPSAGDVLDFTKGEQDLVDFVDTVTFSITDTLQSGFSQAWEKIFGEANSLVEQLLSNLANGLMNLAMSKAAEGIFDFILSLIPGGTAVGSLVNGLSDNYRGHTPNYSRQGGNTTTIIKLGDETVLKLVNGVLPQAYNNSVRYRELETA